MKYIEPVVEYETSIDWLLNISDKDTLFISGWDKSPSILNFDEELLKSISSNYENVNKYIMAKDMIDAKKQIVRNHTKNLFTLKHSQVSIVSNGTSAAFISLLQVRKKNKRNVLFIGPIYFTYKHLSCLFDFRMFHMNINPFGEIIIDLKKLEKELLSNEIDCIIISIPFFGTGVTMSNKLICMIISVCEKHGIFSLIDYVYGNMEWNRPEAIHNYKLVNMVTTSNHAILYESIPKQIFLNGIKHSIIYGSSELIRSINIDSEICQGSISYVQESLLNRIYSNDEYIVRSIENAKRFANNNYHLICTITRDTGIIVSNANSGYFALIGVPVSYFEANNEKDIAKEIHVKKKILTIPHSRYYYSLKDYYCFRVNLSLKTESLIEGIESVLDIGSN